jgi:hypothetical protein
MADNFEFFIQKGHLQEGKKEALVVVADTMFLARMWLRQSELPETVENMARFTELVLRYEIERERLSLDEKRTAHEVDGVY